MKRSSYIHTRFVYTLLQRIGVATVADLPFSIKSMLASLAKQLDIQKQVTEICERDLAYRTEIIELLSARIIQLETESETWKEQRKSFAALKEKMGYLEQLYGGDGARELELAIHTDGPAIPDDQTLVEITYLENLKSQIERSRADMQSWTIRISGLESQLEGVRKESSASQAAYAKLDKEKCESDRSYEARISSLQTEVDALQAAGSKASARIEEVRDKRISTPSDMSSSSLMHLNMLMHISTLLR